MKTYPKILVVEDSAPGRDIISTFLEKIGFSPVQAPDGKVAIELILDRSHSADQQIAAVLADLRMPRMDGMELLRNIRAAEQNPIVKEVPFVFVTATSDWNLIQEAKQLNVSGYILKPVTFERIQNKLTELFTGPTKA